MSKMSLNKKIWLLIAAMVLIICGMDVVSFYRSYAQMDAMVNSTGSSFIKRAAVMIDLFFEQYQAMARDVGSFYVLLHEENAPTVRDGVDFSKHLARFLEENKKFGITNIFLVSAKTGRVTDGTGWSNDTDYRDSPWYREGMASDQVILGNPYNDPITKQGVFNAMYKVTDREGTPLALLGIVISVDDVRNLVDSQRLSDTDQGRPLFLDENGYLWNDAAWTERAEPGVRGRDKITVSSDIIPESLAALGGKILSRQEGWGDFTAGGSGWRIFYAPAGAHLIVAYTVPKILLFHQIMQLVVFTLLTSVGSIALLLIVFVPVSGALGRTVAKIEHTARSIEAAFGPEADEGEDFFHQERLNRMAMSLQMITDEIQEQMDSTSFVEFRGILGGIHSTLTVVAEQQANLTAHAEEIMAMNNDINTINEQLRRREFVWSGLLEISQSITSTLNFHVALERVVDAVKNVTQAYGICVMRIDKDELIPLILSGYQNTPSGLESRRIPLDSPSLAARAISTHAVHWVEDVQTDSEYQEIDANVRSEVAIPLYQGAQILGALILSFEKRYRRSKDFITMISPVAASLSGYMSSWRAHKEVRSSYEYLMLKFQEIADIYHHETASHLVRVGRYSAMAAAWVGCSLQEQQDILIFSRAHDLGKIRVPVDIVVKPSGLSLEEFEIMKKHTIWGAELIGDAEWLSMARNICLCHHEKWDGSGYPHGLKGDAIPLEGRIVSLVDIYDALRSPRSYKEGYTHEESVTIILEGDGRTLPEHFDPNLWEFFKHNHEEMSRIFDETRDE